MRFFITSDSWEHTHVPEVHYALSNIGMGRFFATQNYGNSLDKIAIVLMCREPETKFKQRIRLSHKNKTLYMDIMLDYEKFIKVNQKTRNKEVADKLINEVPEIIARYKFKDFNLPLFESHLKEWMNKLILKKHDFKMSPHPPVIDYLTVSITGMEDGEIATLYISDESGNILLSNKSTSPTIKVDMSSYPDDIYDIKVIVGTDSLYGKTVKGASKMFRAIKKTN